MSDEKQVECGDIIEYPDGYMIVEKIKEDGMLVGHKLSPVPVFLFSKNPKLVNSDFRYKKEVERQAKKELLDEIEKRWADLEAIEKDILSFFTIDVDEWQEFKKQKSAGSSDGEKRL